MKIWFLQPIRRSSCRLFADCNSLLPTLTEHLKSFRTLLSSIEKLNNSINSDTHPSHSSFSSRPPVVSRVLDRVSGTHFNADHMRHILTSSHWIGDGRAGVSQQRLYFRSDSSWDAKCFILCLMDLLMISLIGWAAVDSACHSYCCLRSVWSAETIKVQIQRNNFNSVFFFFSFLRTISGVWYLCEGASQEVGGLGLKPGSTKVWSLHSCANWALLKAKGITEQITFHMKDWGTLLTIPMNIITRE